jgi:RNA polymerase sigma-70 factor (ECF subfamily)
MTGPILPDDDLIRRASCGDRPALIELLERHGLTVRRQLEGKIDPRWQSLLSEDDVMQETYADALLGIRAFRPEGEGSFVRWLARIARNNLLDAIRELESLRQGGDRVRLGQAEADEASAGLLAALRGTMATASREAMRQEAAVHLHRAMAQLPHAYREVVRRYDLDGETAKQVAEVLGCSPGAVYMRRARALDMLRELLGSSSRI